MTLDTTDIIIIVVAVVITVLLTLCLVNLCYYLWLKRNKSFAAGWGDDNKDGGHHHFERRTADYKYNLTPDNQFEHTVEYTTEGPTRYNRIAST